MVFKGGIHLISFNVYNLVALWTCASELAWPSYGPCLYVREHEGKIHFWGFILLSANQRDCSPTSSCFSPQIGTSTYGASVRYRCLHFEGSPTVSLICPWAELSTPETSIITAHFCSWCLQLLCQMERVKLPEVYRIPEGKANSFL